MPASGQAARAPGPQRLQRRVLGLIEGELETTRCVGLFGARQVGKSTIANQIAEARGEGAIQLSMRRARDRGALANDEEFFAQNADKLIVIDEAHLHPDALDVVHQRLEHELHGRSGRTQFLLLGSSASDLQRVAAERLGARLTPVEIDTLHLLELPMPRRRPPVRGVSSIGVAPAEELISATEETDAVMDSLWLKGGFPMSVLSADDAVSFAWRRSYVAACIRRTPGEALAGLEVGAVRRTLDKIAAAQGSILPVDNSTIEFRTCVRYLDRLGLVRVLPPWSANRNNQLNRRPKVFIRDSGLLHVLRQCPTLEAVEGTPLLMGDSWEGFCIETLVGAVGDRAQAFYYRWNDQDEIDLVLEFSPTRRWAIEIKHGKDPKPSAGFYRACEAVNPERRMFVHRGEATVSIGGGINAYPLRAAVEEVVRA